jgi:hypothetical protein
MKTKAKILILSLFIGATTTFISCSNDDDNCPSQTYSSFAECDKATNDVECICVQDGSEWKAVLNP